MKYFVRILLLSCVIFLLSFQNRSELQKAISFLTATKEHQGAGYIETSGDLKDKFLPHSANIYGAATWQIALALAAKDELKSAQPEKTLFDLIDNQNLLLYQEKPTPEENAWAFFIGPLQSDYLNYVKIQKVSYVPFCSLSMQNACDSLQMFANLQSPIGALYKDTEDSFRVSIEENTSALAGLKMLQQLLILSLDEEPNLSTVNKQKIEKYLQQIDTMLFGGVAPNDKTTEGLYSFFRNCAWNDSKTLFYEGGVANDPEAKENWIPNEADAVQVGVLTVLGQPQVDEWFGFGTSFKAWEHAKDEGAEAINLLRSLICHYEHVSSEEAKEYVASLKIDEKNLMQSLDMNLNTYSTAWMVMLHYKFNPFQLGGGY